LLKPSAFVFGILKHSHRRIDSFDYPARARPAISADR